MCNPHPFRYFAIFERHSFPARLVHDECCQTDTRFDLHFKIGRKHALDRFVRERRVFMQDVGRKQDTKLNREALSLSSRELPIGTLDTVSLLDIGCFDRDDHQKEPENYDAADASRVVEKQAICSA